MNVSKFKLIPFTHYTQRSAHQ